jgi:putative membrane protein
MYALVLALVWLVVLQHVAFMLLEMLWWHKPIGRRVFGTSPQFARESRVLAANQGLYNGFLAAGLAWSASQADLEYMLFFLLCVLVAGVFGGLTVSGWVFLIQGVPALLALVMLFFVG